MRSTSAWHVPQTSTVFVRSGLPMKPAAGDMATVTSSEVGSPPWQLEQPIPPRPWMLAAHCSVMSCCLLSMAAWQVTQPSWAAPDVVAPGEGGGDSAPTGDGAADGPSPGDGRRICRCDGLHDDQAKQAEGARHQRDTDDPSDASGDARLGAHARHDP